MDPFFAVEKDVKHQIKQLQDFVAKISIISNDNRRDFEKTLGELNDAITDLQESIDVVEKQPQVYKLSQNDISDRKLAVSRLIAQTKDLEKLWASKAGAEVKGDTADETEHETAEAQQLQTQMVMREQDAQLDDVYTSMQNIHLQARMMGDELEAQAGLLGELETDVERVGSKVQRGVKQLEAFYEKNSEKWNDCCIGALIVVLVLLLVVSFIL